MKKTTEATKDQTSKTTTATATEPKAAKAKKATPAPATEQPTPQPSSAPAKAEKPAKAAKATKSDADGEATDRLPTTLDELKETKGGFVAFHFLTGKDKDAIAKDLAAEFKLGEAQAAKIVRRITGRVRLYARVFELVPAKK
ncbi:MAG: hypothetical protein AB7O66_24890 [Limisphaerales bacterium]